MNASELTDDAIGKVVAELLERNPQATQADAVAACQAAAGARGIGDDDRARVEQAYRWQAYRLRAQERQPEILPPEREWRRQRPVWLVCALTVATFGIYPVVWLGATWSEMKRELDDSGMLPWGHALSQFVTIYGFFRVHAHYRVLNEMLKDVGSAVRVAPGLAVLGWILASSAILDLVGGGAPSFFLRLLLAVWVVGHGQAGLNTYWRALPDRTVPIRIHPAEWAALAAGVPATLALGALLSKAGGLSAWNAFFLATGIGGALLGVLLLTILRLAGASVERQKGVLSILASMVLLVWASFGVLEPLLDVRGQVVGTVISVEKRPSVETQLSHYVLTLGLEQQVDEFVIPARNGRPEVRLPLRRGPPRVSLEIHPSDSSQLDLAGLAPGNTVRASYRYNDRVATELDVPEGANPGGVYRSSHPVPEIALGVLCAVASGVMAVYAARAWRTRRSLVGQPARARDQLAGPDQAGSLPHAVPDPASTVRPARRLNPSASLNEVLARWHSQKGGIAARWLHGLFSGPFSRKGPNIRDIHFELSGWALRESSESHMVWTDGDGDALTLNLARADPALGDLRDVGAYRSYCRRAAGSRSGGLVSADLVPVDAWIALQFIYKRDEHPAYAYTGMLIIPDHPGGWIVIAMAAGERGTTGVRDALVTLQLAEAGNLEFEMFERPDPSGPSGRIKGWFHDPYDPTYAGLTLCSISDDEKYDALVPGHPLSKVRRTLRTVRSTFSLDAP